MVRERGRQRKNRDDLAQSNILFKKKRGISFFLLPLKKQLSFRASRKFFTCCFLLEPLLDNVKVFYTMAYLHVCVNNLVGRTSFSDTIYILAGFQDINIWYTDMLHLVSRKHLYLADTSNGESVKSTNTYKIQVSFRSSAYSTSKR